MSGRQKRDRSGSRRAFLPTEAGLTDASRSRQGRLWQEFMINGETIQELVDGSGVGQGFPTCPIKAGNSWQGSLPLSPSAPTSTSRVLS
jgi:hypothetical protein